jgi:hypothetical protein
MSELKLRPPREKRAQPATAGAPTIGKEHSHPSAPLETREWLCQQGEEGQSEDAALKGRHYERRREVALKLNST